MDKETLEMLQSILSSVENMEKRIDTKMETIVENTEKRIDTKMETIVQNMEKRIDIKLETMKREIMEGFNTVIEDKVSKEIRLIAEQHGDIVRKLEKLETVDDLEDRVQTLELVAQKHTAEIHELQRA